MSLLERSQQPLKSAHSHRLLWLICLGLLLPLAQILAAGHLQAHTAQRFVQFLQTTQPSEQQAPQPLNADDSLCEACLMASVVAGGAPLTTPMVLAHELVSSQRPLAHFTTAHWARRPLPYRSRAPPLTLS
jgi:hypothetical protein